MLKFHNVIENKKWAEKTILLHKSDGKLIVTKYIYNYNNNNNSVWCLCLRTCVCEGDIGLHLYWVLGNRNDTCINETNKTWTTIHRKKIVNCS